MQLPCVRLVFLYFQALLCCIFRFKLQQHGNFILLKFVCEYFICTVLVSTTFNKIRLYFFIHRFCN
jgi:hypothetical protein